jgi:quercetin dioxygenase-like cupin family protein
MMKEQEIIHNPVTGETLYVLESTPEVFKIAFRLRPGGAVAAAHYHPSQEQKISVLAGELHCRVGRERIVIRAGETARIPPGTVHDQSNPTETEAVAIEELRPGARAHTMFRVLFALAWDGRTNSRGYPDLLIAAAFLEEFNDVVRPARSSERALFALLAPVSRLLGYGRVLERYLREFESGPARGNLGPVPPPFDQSTEPPRQSAEKPRFVDLSKIRLEVNDDEGRLF